MKSIRLDVSRASHTHHTPQALRAHSGPVTSVNRPKSTASSAAANAQPSADAFFMKRKRALATPDTIAASRNIQADGMWKK